MIGAISDHYGIPVPVVEGLALLDEEAYRLATTTGTVARVEPLQAKMLNRYTVVEKNRTTLGSGLVVRS